MYKQIYNIGDLTERIIIENWSYSQDAGGGNIKTLDNAFYIWAMVNMSHGALSPEYGKFNYVYSAKMITRYNSLIASTSTIVYNNARYLVKSVIDDGRFCEILVEMGENQLASGAEVLPTAQSFLFTYIASGGEDSFSDLSLINKNVFGVFKDGVAKALITTGTPAEDEVLYDASTGGFTFGLPFYLGEKAIIQYV